MKVRIHYIVCIIALWLAAVPATAATPNDSITKAPLKSIVDEVIWVVGDEAILKSDVEVMREQALQEGRRWNGDPDCRIPEQLALQKLFLHQADIDSVEVSDEEVRSQLDQQIEWWIHMAGSKEKLEEYKKQTVSQMKAELHDTFRDQLRAEKMRKELVKDVTVSPADVRRYFREMPDDSIPFVPMEVEVQIITSTPKVPQAEIDRIKDELRGFTERVNSGSTPFSTLARFYSEDTGSARQGGEIGFTGRGTLDPAFAAVAFNLTDPKKVSKIVESEFGFHIIQLIEKRGDKVNVRHILMKPKVDDAAIEASIVRLDSIKSSIEADEFTFEIGASLLSDDKDTRNNNGLMGRQMQNLLRTSKFEMQDLPVEVARAVEGLQVGEISKPFTMINERGKTVCAIAKLKNRIEGHRATITEDFQVMKDVVMARRSEEKLRQWVADKIKTVYVRVNDRYKGCDYEYEGWVK